MTSDEAFNPRRASPKPTRKWCKGKVGREHVTVIVIPDNAINRTCRTDERLRWQQERYTWAIGCYHAEICTVCGKQVRPFLKPGECPDMKEVSSDGRASE